MEAHSGKIFHNRTLWLDGQSFRDCRFLNCDLRYRGDAPFVLTGNRYEGSFNLELAREGPGARRAAEEIDADMLRFGYDLGIAPRSAASSGPVWRYHTFFPRGPVVPHGPDQVGLFGRGAEDRAHHPEDGEGPV